MGKTMGAKREFWIMNGRVLKLGALGVLAVHLFFRGFGIFHDHTGAMGNLPICGASSGAIDAFRLCVL